MSRVPGWLQEWWTSLTVHEVAMLISCAAHFQVSGRPQLQVFPGVPAEAAGERQGGQTSRNCISWIDCIGSRAVLRLGVAGMLLSTQAHCPQRCCVHHLLPAFFCTRRVEQQMVTA